MSTPFELPAELNIYAVQSVHESLLAWSKAQAVKAGEVLEVSAKNVTVVDGSGLQLIAAIANGTQAWRLVEASSVFVDACRTIGLTQWLDKRYLKTESQGAGA